MPPTGRPMFFKVADITLTVGGTPGVPEEAYQCQVHAVAITPEPADLETYVTLCGDGQASAQGSPTWTVDMTIAQAWGAADLARILWDHQGEAATIVVQAHGEGVVPTADQPAVQAEVLLQPGPYGGEAETWLEQEVSLPCTSPPVLITAAPGALAAASAKGTATASASA
jgi:hypothetical protein